jgi:FlaA1/EpsC-like NDP-sugar epimerase
VTAPVYDHETEAALQKYLASSRLLDERIRTAIVELVESGVPLAVWGAGTHTLRLLETSSLAQAELVAFIDSNARYQGKHLRGIPILSPHQFARPDAVILISSHVAELEIKDQIHNQLRWPNRIVCLYDDAPTQLPEPASP